MSVAAQFETYRSPMRPTTWRRYAELAKYATNHIGGIALEKLTPRKTSSTCWKLA